MSDEPAVSATPPTSGRRQQRHGLFSTVLRTPRGGIAIAFLALMVLACACAPLVAPLDPLAQHLTDVRSGPSGTYLFGTDSLGRDLLSRLLYGGRLSLLGVFEAVVVYMLVAVPAGLAAGYFGGVVDRVIMRIAELFMSVPVIIILLAVLSIFGHSLTAAMIALGVLSAAGLTRIVRGSALAAREELYVVAAELMGLSRMHVIARHVLSRCRGVIIVQTSLFAALALSVQTGLSYLGLGPQPPAPTWGGMVGDAASMFGRDPWMLVPPGVVIALTVLAFGVLGDVVRDVTADHQPGVETRTRRAAPERRAGTEVQPSSALLSVQHLTVGADGTTLLDDICFEVPHGQTVGLVGESGSGKSMTAHAILELLPSNCGLDGGHVLFDGVDLVDLDEAGFRKVRGRQISLVSQNPMSSLDPSFRIGSLVGEVVKAVEGLRGSAVRNRVIELLEQVGIPDALAVSRRFPHQISGGMAQRVAIAMALAGRPRLLIADEPTTALDVTVQAEILDLLRDLQAENGMAILLVSHNWGVIADMCSSVVVMYAGQVVECSPAGEVFSLPAHPYTDALLRSSPEKAEAGQRITSIPGVVPPPGAWPAGCHFAPRCAFARPECQSDGIPLIPVGGHRASRCVRTEVLFETEVSR